MANSTATLRRPLRTRILQNFHLVWLDENIDEGNDHYQSSITQLQQIVNTVNTFTNIDECIDFVTDISEETALMIISELYMQDIFSIVQDVFQIQSVYVLCKSLSELKQDNKKWSKFHGAYTDMTSLCKTIREDSKVHDHNAISFSFLKELEESSVANLDALDCSFMYTQMLKDILLTIDFTPDHISQFLAFCREQYTDSETNLNMVKKIEKEYKDHSSIWWYTSDSFLYGMLNRALRVMDVNVIIKIGFFLRDVYCRITELHKEQFGDLDLCDPFTVYRGQALSVDDFNKFKSSKGGLLAFNSFLSTSFLRAAGSFYAENNLGDPSVMGVLFVINIDPALSPTSFASITSESTYGNAEGEILFSMHSIFRIGEVKQMGEHPRLWQVELTLTNDNDPQLMTVKKIMEEETSSAYTGWDRLGKLLVKLGQYEKAQELYEIFLAQTDNQEQQAHLYRMLGAVHRHQGNYSKALRFYKQSLEIKKNLSTSRRPVFVQIYADIADVCRELGKYSDALEIYEKCLRISEKRLHANHSVLCNIYSGIGKVYMITKEYSKAFKYAKKVLEIVKEKLPENHPTLAAAYDDVAYALHQMNEHSKTIEYRKKAIDIRRKILPHNHPNYAFNLNTIASEYRDIGEYSRALELYESALDHWQQTLPENHTFLAVTYDNICLVYMQMNENSKALTYCEKAIQIREKALFPYRPALASSYNQLGKIHGNMQEHRKSIEYFEKAIDVLQKILPSNHPDLAAVYNNLAMASKKASDYCKAIEYSEKAIAILQESSRSNVSTLASTYGHLGDLYKNISEYTRAIEYYDKAIGMFEEKLPSAQSDLANLYNTLGIIYKRLNDYPKALVCYLKNLEISQKTLPANDSRLAISCHNIAQLFKRMSNYAEALKYFQLALEIRRQLLPPDHPTITNLQKQIENVKEKLKIFSSNRP